MKILVVTIYFAFSLFTSNSFAQANPQCPQLEAQFIGVVTEVLVEEIGPGHDVYNCFFKLSFSYYMPSQICPLEFNKVENSYFSDFGCRLQLEAGQPLSGVLGSKGGSIYLD